MTNSRKTKQPAVVAEDPAKESPAKETPTKETSTKETPTKETPAKETATVESKVAPGSPVEAGASDHPAAPEAPGNYYNYDNPENILPASHWATAVVEGNDDDSSYGDDAASSTASITSSILAYRTINGRTYHAERGTANYWVANDEKQLESMDLYSHLCYLMCGKKLFKAPLEESNLKKALDIGTGTGVWAIDFADMFPECEVTGTDVSVIQSRWTPPNVKFEIEDCTQEWTFLEASFDYVHMRLLYGSISDWPTLFDQAYRVTRSGGWIESVEASPVCHSDDGTVKESSAIGQWGKFYVDGGNKIGRTFRVIEENIQINEMKRLGLEDVQVMDVKCPVGSWPKDPDLNEMGRVAQATLEQDYEGYLTLMANISRGWSREEVCVYCARLRNEFRDTRYHGYFNFRAVWGRRP